MYNHDNDGQYGQIVTFHKEGVDWNKFLRAWIQTVNLSPSARKVWIEIKTYLLFLDLFLVTFRKEGVDWNVTP